VTVGDKYRVKRLGRKYSGLNGKRYESRAYRITHPITGERLYFTVPAGEPLIPAILKRVSR
jgi:hypothetical protein